MDRSVIARLAVLALVGATSVASAMPPASTDWRRVATAHDRQRLRGWRTAWIYALKAARSGDGAAAIAADPALFNPDRVLANPLPPAGAYRCRVVKLGGGGVTQGFTVRPWGECRVEEGASGLKLSRSAGAQRPMGLIFADTDARAVFLGTIMHGDDRIALPYGRDEAHDLAGLVERIGSRRWRIVLPYPRYESLLDIVELEPAAS